MLDLLLVGCVCEPMAMMTASAWHFVELGLVCLAGAVEARHETIV